MDVLDIPVGADHIKHQLAEDEIAKGRITDIRFIQGTSKKGNEWKAWVIDIEPANSKIIPFSANFYLEKNETPQDIGVNFLPWINLFSEIAETTYDIDDFKIRDLIGAEIQLQRLHGKNQYILLDVYNVPALEDPPDFDELSDEERAIEHFIDRTSNRATTKGENNDG